MNSALLWRARLLFGCFAIAAVVLVGRLFYLQVLQAGELAQAERAPLRLVTATAELQGRRAERLPAPRATIVDRSGQPLAFDREVYEVRARITVPRSARENVLAYLSYFADLANDLAMAMASEPTLANRSATAAHHRQEFLQLFAKEFRTANLASIPAPADAPLPAGQRLVADLRLLAKVEELRVIEALRGVADRRGSLQLDFLHAYERSYPERELTYGVVGHVETVWHQPEGSGPRQLLQRGVCGLEAMPATAAGPADLRRYRSDRLGRPYFQAPLNLGPKPAVLHSTLDLDLQRAAVAELTAQAEQAERDGKGKNPKWGALVLVEIATGDVLAAAAWHRDEQLARGASFTPYQTLFEPGSIVKPLVLAYAYAAGALDWQKRFDCTHGSSEYRERIGGLGRRNAVLDDHACGVQDAHGILVNSSNIGAAYIGLQLSREQWRNYMDGYGFGHSLGLGLPFEARGGPNRRSFAADIPLRQFRANSAISFSFGYEYMATPLQIARAYLRLFRGHSAELRLVRAVDSATGTQFQPMADPGRGFAPAVVDAVRAALADVVGPDPQATGHRMRELFLRQHGIELHGLVGGKTGTAVSEVPIAGRGKIRVRNASFVGFLPADAPRWLAVCVLQKDDHVQFYGGSYAAPAATRLLLQAQRQSQRRLLQQELRSSGDGQVAAGTWSSGLLFAGDAAGERNSRDRGVPASNEVGGR